MNRAVVYFSIQCFQLRDVDRVGILAAGGYILNLAFFSFSAYGNDSVGCHLSHFRGRGKGRTVT